jgi:hypothetical protein
MTGLEPIIHWAAKDWMGFIATAYEPRPPMVRRLKHRRFHLEPIRKELNQFEAFVASRLSMMRIMARRMKAATVLA